MKKLFFPLIFVLSTLSCFSQSAGQVDLNKLFEDAKNDYQSIMKFPHNESCEQFLTKYKNVSGLDSLKSQVLNSFLQDIEDIYKNTDWNRLKDIHYYSNEYYANMPKNRQFMPDNATAEQKQKYNSDLEEFNSLRKKYVIENEYPKDIIKTFHFNRIIKRAFEKAIELNNPAGFLAFRDTFNSYTRILLHDRDSLERNKEIYFKTDNLGDYYLQWIGFSPSTALYEKVKPSILLAARPLIIATLKSDETKLSLYDISEFATPFMTFNSFSDQNHKEYFNLWLTILKDESPDAILHLFDLTDKYSTPLQVENFKNSPEYALLKIRKDSLKTNALSKFYFIDLNRTHVEGELDLGGLFMISNYDMVKKGFTITFNPYSTPNSSFNNGFSIVVPKVISRVDFESIPFPKIEDKATTLNTPNARITSGSGSNILFIPTDINVGGKIEEAGDQLKIELLFNLDDAIKSSTVDNVLDYVKAGDCKLIIWNSDNSNILYSKVYKKQIPVATQTTTNKQVTTNPIKK